MELVKSNVFKEKTGGLDIETWQHDRNVEGIYESVGLEVTATHYKFLFIILDLTKGLLNKNPNL